MSEYSDLIQAQVSQGPALAAGAADANPDDAARAIQLSGATGVPASAIAGDLDGFERQHKTQLAADLVRGNPQLNAYVQSHPLAAQVSNDDYGAMDQFSQGAGQTSTLMKVLNAPRQVFNAGVSGAVEGLKEGFGDQPLGQQADDAQSRLGYAIGKTGWVPLDFMMRGVSAIGGAISGAAGGAATQAGGEQFGRDIQAMTEYEMTKGEGHPEIVEQLAKQQELHAAIKPWTDAGMEPPVGVHPEIDAAKAQMNQHALEGLDQDLSNAQQSQTKERSPELFAQFVRQHYGDAEIGIHGDSVAALYGDKAPAPDDGILGWVPGIEDKLAIARETGADVRVPVSDWVSKVDPSVASGLHDDIRMWPGGITAREATAPIEPKAVVDSPLAQARDASSLEPLYAIGDRKLTLDPSGQILDDQGKPLGELHAQLDGTDVKLDQSTLDLSTAGPSLVKDLRRQLAEQFPEAKTIEGANIPGWGEVDNSNEYNHFKSALEDAHWRDYSANVRANNKPIETYPEEHQALNRSIIEELRKTLGDKVGAAPVADITMRNLRPSGVFMQYPDRAPKILYDLFGEGPLGVARHEGIHFLRRYGMITEPEWKTLTEASKREGWAQRYDIVDRYAKNGFSDEVQMEESIAEGYRDWATQRDLQPKTEVSGVFEKMAGFWDRLKEKFKSLLGGEDTWQQTFEKIYTGQMADRPTAPIGAGAYDYSSRAEPHFSLPDEAREQLESMKASAAGLDKKTWDRLQRLIKERYAEDIEAATARRAKEEARTQTKEWKENQRQVRSEVEATIRQRPDIAADAMLGRGELFGEKLDERPRLLASDLTEEQKAALPRQYYGAEGLPTDMVANLFGYGSGDAMVERLGALRAARGDLEPAEFMKKLIDDETARQMQARYGNLQDNIMQEARDQVLSETNLNLLAEELKAAGEQAGKATIDKAVLKQWVDKEFSKLPIGSVSVDHYMNLIGRHGRDAERALIGNDPATAVVSLQRKYVAALFAANARKLEKEVARFDKQTKSYAKREIPGMEPEYTNFVHGIMQQIGKPVRRSVQDLEGAIAGSGHADLEGFVTQKQADLREVPVWDQLFDKGWRKDYKSLTAEEFRSVRDSIKTLVANGRDERKIYKAGEVADFAEVKTQLKEAVQQFPALTYDAKDQRAMGPVPQKLANSLRSYVASHMQIETLLNRWDHFDPHGVWNQYVMRDLVDAANQKDAWVKEFAARIKATDGKVDLSKQIDNPIFRSMVGNNAPLKLTRGNLRAIMLNVGTESNLTKLARGRGLTEDQVMGWVHQHATKEDWEWTQKTWDIFSDLKARSDTMYRSLSGGVAPESLPARSIETPHGTYAGGYYPVIYAEEGQRSKALMGKGPLEEEGYVRATTPAGYTKGRTGYVGPVSLDIDQMPNRMKQVIHDTAMRPAIINAGKVFYDTEIQAAISGHYGKEYKDLLVPYLRDVANNSNFMSKAQRSAGAASEFIRQNMISTLVGMNPGTVLKHGPTALVQSMHEVGSANFLRAAKGMFSINEETGERNWQFAMQHSTELQRRHQNYEETLSGAVQSMVPTSKYDSLRRTVMKYSSMPVAMSDLLSATPTWLAQYSKSAEEGLSHGDSVYMADRAVRRAHGSTASTNRPGIVRDANPWMTSVYGFFNHIMNRQMEMVWRAGEMVGDVKEGDWPKAKAAIAPMAGMMFAYAIAPAVIEQLVAGGGDPKEKQQSWGVKAAEGMVETAGASWVGVRDITSAIMHGRDPSAGLLPTAYKSITDIVRDFRKDRPFNKEHAGRLIQDASAMVGTMTGLVNESEGRAARFAHDVAVGKEHPKGPWGWVIGSRFGTLKNHSATMEDWMKGK